MCQICGFQNALYTKDLRRKLLCSSGLIQMKSGKRDDENISEQLTAIQNLLVDQNKMLTEFLGSTAQWIEERNKEGGEEDRRIQRKLFNQSIVLGFLIGLLGNLFVSYFMKAIEFFESPPLVYVASTIIIVVFMFIIIYPFYRVTKNLS